MRDKMISSIRRGMGGDLTRKRSATRPWMISAGVMALTVAAGLAIGLGDVYARGGTAKPPPAPPPGACPNGAPATSACILPPAGPVLPNFPAAGGALSGNGSNGFSISGHIQALTPGCPAAAGSNAGGTVKVNGITITIPSDVIVQYPANTLTWTDAVCGINAIALNGSGSTAPALYPGVEIRVEGNIPTAPAVLAASAPRMSARWSSSPSTPSIRGLVILPRSTSVTLPVEARLL